MDPLQLSQISQRNSTLNKSQPEPSESQQLSLSFSKAPSPEIPRVIDGSEKAIPLVSQWTKVDDTYLVKWLAKNTEDGTGRRDYGTYERLVKEVRR